MKNKIDVPKLAKTILVGKIVKAQGIKGDVKVLVFADSDFDFLTLTELIVGGEVKKVQKSYRIGSCYGVKLEGVDTCNAAESLKNCSVEILRENFNLPAGRYLIADLIGRPVALSTGKVVGVIEDVQNFGSADVIYISNDGVKIMCSHKEGLIEKIDEYGRVIFNDKIFAEVGVYDD